MKLPVLYTFRRCPYAMRARLAMYYSKINYEHREISLKNRPRELYNISSKGTVPVLELQSGKVIDESFEIMKWAISLNDPKKWFHNLIIITIHISPVTTELFCSFNFFKLML